MNLLPVLCLLLAAAYADPTGSIDFQAIIDEVNSGPAKWKAGHNFDPNTPLSHIVRLLGAKPSPVKQPIREKHTLPDSAVPTEFDSRKQWPNCPTIDQIYDQSNCGSCWALGAATAFSDRYCIATNGKFTLPLSADQLLSCCEDCGKGCKGGFTIDAWYYFNQTGLVTGGKYQSNVGCQPYEFPPCEHHTTGKLPACTSLPDYDTPQCHRNCTNPSYKEPIQSDFHKLKEPYFLDTDESEIKKEILLHGPVEAAFDVYPDFLTYKSGVYHHVTGHAVSGHAVRVIGWGVEGDTPYWLVANSWNEDWGDKGLFKILRGSNECGFEGEMVAGLPDV